MSNFRISDNLNYSLYLYNYSKFQRLLRLRAFALTRRNYDVKIKSEKIIPVFAPAILSKDDKSEKYEISDALDIPGGKVIAARDECSNVFAGMDLVEAKLLGQIRRYKLEMQPDRQKKGLRNLFIKRK